MKTERGQALVETLLAVPLFLIIAMGALVFAHVTRGRLASGAWQERVRQTVAHFDPQERRIAKWPRAPGNLQSFWDRKPEAGACAKRGDPAFCFGPFFDRSEILKEGLLGPDADAVLKNAPIRTPIEGTSHFLPGALTPFARRASGLSTPLVRSLPLRTLPGHPAETGILHGTRWTSAGGFNLSSFLSTGRHDHPGPLDAILLKTARRSRAAQSAACVAESAYESLALGALVELLASAILEGGAKGKSCPSAARALQAISLAARLALAAKAAQTLAAESCALAQATRGYADAEASGPLCSHALSLATFDHARSAIRESGALETFLDGRP